MTKTRPFLWVLLPITLLLAVGSIWGTFNYGPIGKPAAAVSDCAELRDFIISEEKLGKANWNQYRDLADQYGALAPNSTQRTALVEDIAISVIEVLGHDLAIYKEMEKFPVCIKAARRTSLSGIISETESAINFLNGSAAIEGNYFDPSTGNWNTAYYSEYVSALDFLKSDKSSGPTT